MSNEVLLIMQPREIPVAIESYKKLNIPKVWFQAFTERQVVEEINKYVQRTNYDTYYIISDDAIVTDEALSLIRLYANNGFDVVTGWCRLSEQNSLINIVKKPLTRLNGVQAIPADYCLYTEEEIREIPVPIFRTWFSGFVFTGIKRELFLKYPLITNAATGCQSDFELSYRLQQDGIPIFVVRDASIIHLKKHQDFSLESNWLVGVRPPQIIEEL